MIYLSYQWCEPDTDTEKESSWRCKDSEVKSEKWRRLLLHWMYDALNISTDGREEDSFPRNRCSGSIV
ncbi:hypothetical protein Tco_0068082, partial [Tanacetum coccineum]